MAKLSPTELADRAGISVPYASQLLSGTKTTPSLKLALQVYDRTGLQFGFLEGLTPEEIEPLRRQLAA
jgi:transcriptional regulator with XRE-family HTH domain